MNETMHHMDYQQTTTDPGSMVFESNSNLYMQSS